MGTRESLLSCPLEIVHNIVGYLRADRHCGACIQTDLASLCLTSRRLHAIVTPYLYATPVLVSGHRPSQTEDAESDCEADDELYHRTGMLSYPRRLRMLHDTIRRKTHLGEQVKGLQFDPVSEDRELWEAVLLSMPNIEKICGIRSFFGDDDDSFMSDGLALRSLGKLRFMVLEMEHLPVRLEQLLGCWRYMEELTLGNIDPNGGNYGDLVVLRDNAAAAAAEGRPGLRELNFWGMELENSPGLPSADDVLAILPPLERLAINYSLDFSLDGVIRFLKQSPVHSERLLELHFTQQLKSKNPLQKMVNVVAAAPNLEHLQVKLLCWRADSDSEEPECSGVLASKELIWLNYAQFIATDGAKFDFAPFSWLLLASLSSLPRLEAVRVEYDYASRVKPESEDPEVLFKVLLDECRREESALTLDEYELYTKPHKRVLMEFTRCNRELQSPPQVKIVEMKEGETMVSCGLGGCGGARVEEWKTAKASAEETKDPLDDMDDLDDIETDIE